MIMSKKMFDPVEARKTLLGDLGVEWQLQRSLDNSKNQGGLSSSARADLGAAIQCILVDLVDPASRLLAKAHKWSLESTESDNEIANWMTYQTISMSEWLSENRQDLETRKELMTELERAINSPAIANDAVNVSLLLPLFLDCGEYERVLEIVEQTQKISEPDNLEKIPNEAQMCFVIARHRLGMAYTEEEVANACEKFISRNMDKWLRDGHSVRAALWMKIIWSNSDDSVLSPNETILKCYEYLKDCKPLI
jgi:hypothetical protein